jgi:hypothetical protein
MGKVYVKNGTPVEKETLCRTCANAQIMEGYRESELIVLRGAPYRELMIPFKIRDCSAYGDKNKPSWEQMEKLAINVVTATSFSKPVGFCAHEAVREEEDDCAVARNR